MNSGSSPLGEHRDGTLIELHVQPRASRSEIVGIHDGTLRVRITAPPVEGAANEAIVDLLSKQLGVRKSDIVIVSGVSGRRKRVLVRGVDAEAIQASLGLRE